MDDAGKALYQEKANEKNTLRDAGVKPFGPTAREMQRELRRRERDALRDIQKSLEDVDEEGQVPDGDGGSGVAVASDCFALVSPGHPLRQLVQSTPTLENINMHKQVLREEAKCERAFDSEVAARCDNYADEGAGRNVVDRFLASFENASEEAKAIHPSTQSVSVAEVTHDFIEPKPIDFLDRATKVSSLKPKLQLAKDYNALCDAIWTKTNTCVAHKPVEAVTHAPDPPKTPCELGTCVCKGDGLKLAKVTKKVGGALKLKFNRRTAESKAAKKTLADAFIVLLLFGEDPTEDICVNNNEGQRLKQNLTPLHDLIFTKVIF